MAIYWSVSCFRHFDGLLKRLCDSYANIYMGTSYETNIFGVWKFVMFPSLFRFCWKSNYVNFTCKNEILWKFAYISCVLFFFCVIFVNCITLYREQAFCMTIQVNITLCLTVFHLSFSVCLYFLLFPSFCLSSFSDY